MDKKYYIAAAVLAIVGASIMGASAVSAQNADVRQNMIKSLAQKLGIEESKVQTAMEAIHTERQAEMQKKMEVNLTQAVKDGKITEAQKQLILKKHAEMKAERENWKESMQNLTPEQRKAAMEKKRAELQSWAKENGIDMSVFQLGMGPKGGMRGFGHMK